MNLEDYRWLVGAEAKSRLDEVAGASASLVRLAATLRKSLSAERTHLVLEQVALRRRAREKFGDTGRLFFTEKGLQQATDESIGQYKASRFPSGAPIADLCCGIGGDLMSFGRRGVATGVELDGATAVLADANCRTVQDADRAHVLCQSAEDTDLGEFAAWHIDPDRRAAGRRVSHPSAYAPTLDVLQDRIDSVANGSIKLAPATGVPTAWQRTAELEWIESRGECRQQVAWFGELARFPGRRVATIISADSSEPRSVVEPGPLERGPLEQAMADDAGTGRVRRYLFEPAAAVLAAGLVAVLAEQHGLAMLAPNVAYFTGDQPLCDAALDSFEVLEHWPLDLKKIRRALRERKIGRLEVKKRGVALDPASIRRQLKLRGDNPASLLIAPMDGRIVAFLARRCTGESGNPHATP